MAISRFSQLAHWGAFTAVVEQGQLLRCEPFKHDQHLSPMLASIAPMLYSDQRGHEDFVEIRWDHALDLIAQENRQVWDRFGAKEIFTGSDGWSSAVRVHHARSLMRRFHFAGGGAVDQAGNYSWGAAQFFYRILSAAIVR